MNTLKSTIASVAIMVVIAMVVTGCAGSRSGQVYSRDEARQVQTV